MNWRKSSYSGQSGGNCVEVAGTDDSCVIVRDTQEKASPALRFPADAWRRMVNEVKSSTSLVPGARAVREPFSSARERFLYHLARRSISGSGESRTERFREESIRMQTRHRQVFAVPRNQFAHQVKTSG